MNIESKLIMLKKSNKYILGSRIAIIGLSCSGKSTLAKCLSDKYQMPLLHLDAIAHEPNTNWKKADNKAFAKGHNTFIKQDNWVIEGNYSVHFPQRFSKATSIIWLLGDSRLKFLWTYLKRCFGKKARIGAPENMHSEFSWTLIWYIIKKAPNYHIKYQRLITQNAGDITIITLKGRDAVNQFYIDCDLAETRDQILNKKT